MAQPNYLQGTSWKCNGDVFNFSHEAKSPEASCIVIGKISRQASFLTPYGDFDLEKSLPSTLRHAKFKFSLVCPDNCCEDFQTNFDTCVSNVEAVVNNFPEIDTCMPFLSIAPQGRMLNFTHNVFKYVCYLLALCTYKFLIMLLHRSHLLRNVCTNFFSNSFYIINF